MPWTIDSVVGRMLELEEELIELRCEYLELKEQYEKDCARYRNEFQSQKDLDSGNKGY